MALERIKIKLNDGEVIDIDEALSFSIDKKMGVISVKLGPEKPNTYDSFIYVPFDKVKYVARNIDDEPEA